MTNFNADRRVRDKEPDSTGLGSNFLGSPGDIARFSVRPSPNYLGYLVTPVSNDDGSSLNDQVEKKLDLILTELQTLNTTLAGVLRTKEEPSS